MASLSKDKNGNRTIQFINDNGKRKSIRLGKMDKKNATTIKTHVEYILSAKVAGLALDNETSKWLVDLGPKLAEKLEKVGLIDRPYKALLGEFIEDYVTRKSRELKPGTMQVFRLAQRNLVTFFGACKRLNAVTPGDADDFRSYLISIGLAESTNRKRCSIASQIFRYAVRHRVVQANPFEDIPKANIGTEHLEYVSEAVAVRVMEDLPNSQLKVLFAMSRWGGLRVGSEVRTLTWSAINWENKRFEVVSPKTQRYKGHGSRQVPLFPELESLLRQWRAEAPRETDFVLPMLIGRSDASLRKYVFNAIRKSGEAPWKRLWHNLRASRQTDLEQKHPTHVVCSWLGNSEAIARKHYLQVTETDFAKAVQKAMQQPAVLPNSSPRGDQASQKTS